MARDLLLYLDHTNQHIIDRIKEEHPEWVSANGACEPCAEYYKKQISGEVPGENIGPRGRQRRLWMGAAMLLLIFFLVPVMKSSGMGQFWKLALFPLVFLGMLGLIQAREKTCAVLAEFGLRNMDAGELKITNPKVEKALRWRGRVILFKSAFWAVLFTVVLFLLP